MVAYWSGCRQKINGSLKPSNGGELSERTAYKDVWKEGKVKVNSRKWWSTVELTIVEKCHLSRPAAARKGEVTGTQGEKAAAGVCLKGVAVFGGGTESHHGQGDMQLLSLFSLSLGDLLVSPIGWTQLEARNQHRPLIHFIHISLWNTKRGREASRVKLLWKSKWNISSSQARLSYGLP